MSRSTDCYQGHVVQLKVVLLWSAISKGFLEISIIPKDFRVLKSSHDQAYKHTMSIMALKTKKKKKF